MGSWRDQWLPWEAFNDNDPSSLEQHQLNIEPQWGVGEIEVGREGWSSSIQQGGVMWPPVDLTMYC